MQITTVQWNIGGAKIRGENADPVPVESYTHEGFEYLIQKLKEYNPGVITLQENHADETGSQAGAIAKALGWQYFFNDRYDQSHIDPTQGLCQSIISKYPLSEHSFTFFYNPPFKRVMENGEEWTSHNKGMTTCKADVGGISVTFQTLHAVPFRPFAVDLKSPEAVKVLQSMDALIDRMAPHYVFQGDFNYPELSELFPETMGSLTEVGGKHPTTPRGKLYDHILCRGAQPISVSIDTTALTDHYPVIATLEI
jgi:hypothetical protein